MSDTSEFLKGKIVALHEHTSKSGREVARDLGLSHATVARVINDTKNQVVLTLNEKEMGSEAKNI